MPLLIVRNDITTMAVDAIVNASDKSLSGGGGVDRAIHKAGGPKLTAACRALGSCRTGEALITEGYDLPAKYVIHTAGPIWRGGTRGEPSLLADCYRNSLELAVEHGCETVAFPLISAGVYRYPKDQALHVASDTIGAFLAQHDLTVYLVIFGRKPDLIDGELIRSVAAYIDDVYPGADGRQERTEAPRRRGPLEKLTHLSDACEKFSFVPAAGAAPPAESAVPDWDAILKQTDEGFSQALLRMIDEQGMSDVECYKKANIDRKLFSKIRGNPAYRPSKPTVFAFAVALELSLEETAELLQKAGFALTHSSKFDIILEYFIRYRIYDIFRINEVLFQYDLPLLGS